MPQHCRVHANMSATAKMGLELGHAMLTQHNCVFLLPNARGMLTIKMYEECVA